MSNSVKGLWGVLIAVLVAGLGCGASPGHGGSLWPSVDTLASAVPADLDQSAPATVLRQGSDGYLYIVGGIPDSVRSGTVFFARYSGDWPLEDLPRPPLVTGHVVKVFGSESARVSLSYVLPQAEAEGLEVTWETDPLTEPVGKGIGHIVRATVDGADFIEVNLGGEHGVEVGDIYALVRRPEPDFASDVQLARRVTSICMVSRVNDATSLCRVRPSSTLLAPSPVPKVGERAVFLEHTFGKLAPVGVIQVAAIDGDDGRVRGIIAEALSGFMGSVQDPQASVELLEEKLDATRVDFHAVEDKLVHLKERQLLVAGSLRTINGAQHLIVNYTSIGTPSGPSFVAAPPEGGVDMGPVDQLTPESFRGFAGVVWSAMLVHRGQTSRAMIHLKNLLEDSALNGKLRWHARDQFAMRWMGLDRRRLAKWLVEEDIAVAKAHDDRDAYLNALGTIIHLEEMLGNPAAALKSATEYYNARKGERPTAPYVAAHGMLIQMLLKNAKMDAAQKELDSLKLACPEGCAGQLAGVVGSLVWSVPEGQDAFSATILETVVTLASQDKDGLPTARVLQGFAALKKSDFEQALIAFLEAGRLYEAAGNTLGVGRTKYLEMVAQIRRLEPEDALKAGVEALKIAESSQDYADFAMIYSHMAQVFSLSQGMTPGPYLAAAPEVLAAGVQCKMSLGDEGGMAEALYALGSFLLQMQQYPDAQVAFQRAVFSSIRSARFDVAALSHLSLAVIARQQSNAEVFRDEIRRARLMAEISEDESIKEAIQRSLEPPARNEDPTQLL